MLALVALQFLVLTTAGVLLAAEAHTGRLDGQTPTRTTARAVVYFLAVVAGATLLIAIADGEWLIALALVPVTLLSLLRFSMLARRWWDGWRLPVLTGLLVILGITLSLPWMPFPLDRAFILEQLQVIEDASTPANTIDPEAMQPVRV